MLSRPLGYPLPLPMPPFNLTPERVAPPGKSRTSGEISPGPAVDAGGDVVMLTPPQDLKRAKRSLAEGLAGAVPPATTDEAPGGL